MRFLALIAAYRIGRHHTNASQPQARGNGSILVAGCLMAWLWLGLGLIAAVSGTIWLLAVCVFLLFLTVLLVLSELR